LAGGGEYTYKFYILSHFGQDLTLPNNVLEIQRVPHLARRGTRRSWHGTGELVDRHTEVNRMLKSWWHLDSVGPSGQFTFVAGQPQDYVYRLDYINPAKDKPSYPQLFQDAGWEHVSEMFNWQYFRKHVQEGETPEIYTDVESKVEKYRRLLIFEVVILFILVATTPRSIPYFPPVLRLILTVLIALLLMIHLYIVIRTWRRINQSKRL
jgi:hypothetical protein